jgi:hypothetical protein
MANNFIDSLLDWNTRSASKARPVDKGAAYRNYRAKEDQATARANTRDATDLVAKKDAAAAAAAADQAAVNAGGAGFARIGATSPNMSTDPAQRGQAKLDAERAAAGANAREFNSLQTRHPAPIKTSAGNKVYSQITGGFDQNTSRKTDAAAAATNTGDVPITYSRKEILGKNVLNDYANYTYNFTLSGLRRTSLLTENGGPTIKLFEDDSRDYTILTSGGKGKDYSMKESSIGLSNSTKKENRALTDKAVGFIEGFNQNSPGRFDMYIDNLEIDTLLSFSGKSGPTLPLAFRFEVYEPYSINGFLEALQAAALGCGYANYSTASFLLKMNFIGYNSDDELETDIPNSTRYFGIRITKIQLEVTAKGSRYVCVGLPFNEFAFTDEINKLHQNVQFQGSTVKDILKNFLDNVEFQRLNANKEAYSKEVGGASPTGYDKYYVLFGDANSNFDDLRDSPVYSSDLKDSKIFTFSDNQSSGNANGYGSPGSKQLPAARPAENTISFSANSNISDCIAAVITESEWAKKLLKNIKFNPQTKQWIGFDSDTGLVDYFIVRAEVKNLDTFDIISNRFYHEFTYKISPYKIHYTMIPGYQQDKFVYDKNMKKHFLIRQYDYIYTGENRDILDFKINFNNSLYAAIPAAMGSGGLKNSLANAVSPKAIELGSKKFVAQSRSDPPEDLSKDIPTPYSAVLPTLNSYRDNLITSGSISAGPPTSDPYYMQAKAMYEAVVKRTYNMTEVELSILGDPVFLVMGGVSNFDPKSTNGVVGENGSLNQNYGTPYVEVTFNNPTDIMSNGFLDVESKGRLAFSGVFMVKKLVSKFSNGVFTQRMQLARMPQQGENDQPIVSRLVDEDIKKPGSELAKPAEGASAPEAVDFRTGEIINGAGSVNNSAVRTGPGIGSVYSQITTTRQ